MKKNSLIFLLSLISLISFAKINYVISSGDSTDLQPRILAAINASNKYDTVMLPSGTNSFDNKIVITKKIWILGYNIGSCKTKLYRRKAVDDATLTSWNYFFYFDIQDSTDQTPFGIKNVHFESKRPSYSPNDGGSSASDYGIVINKGSNFVIRDCSFVYFGNSGVLIRHYDNVAKGVIANNYFSTCKTYTGLGLGYGVTIVGEYKKWIPNVKWGSDNFIFIEDNKFNELRHSIASNGGALLVPRYNYILNNIVAAASAIDGHPKEDGATGTRAVECYNNTIINTHFKVHKWPNQAARDAYVPYHPTEDYGIQLDNGVLYKSNGTAAGAWIVSTLPKSNHLGAPFITGKSATELGECAIVIKGGESLISNNTVVNWRFSSGLLDDTGYKGQYPVPMGPGWESGVNYGECHYGTEAEYVKGDMHIWGNTFVPYAGSSSSMEVYNYTPTYFKDKRDYHLTAKLGYIKFLYPHPLNKL